MLVQTECSTLETEFQVVGIPCTGSAEWRSRCAGLRSPSPVPAGPSLCVHLAWWLPHTPGPTCCTERPRGHTEIPVCFKRKYICTKYSHHHEKLHQIVVFYISWIQERSIVTTKIQFIPYLRGVGGSLVLSAVLVSEGAPLLQETAHLRTGRLPHRLKQPITKMLSILCQ